MKGCSLQGCDDPHYARGWCQRHYMHHYRRYGKRLDVSPTSTRRWPKMRHP